MWTRAERYARENNCGEWDFYETSEFSEYLENYAQFIKEYRAGIDVCANVDVLPFRRNVTPPKGKDSHSLSYKHLHRLEDLGVRPVPIVHYKATIDVWLRRYVEEGYPLIGLGGLVGSISDDSCRIWIDNCFNFLCQEDGRPMVKLHGFGVTSHEYLLRYPWYSVDSTTWTKHGAYGHILVPKQRNGQFILSPTDLEAAGLPLENWAKHCQPWLVTMSQDSGKRKVAGGLHYLILRENEQRVVREWLDHIGIELGDEATGAEGVITNHNYRRTANLLFFEEVRKALLDYATWTWASARPVGFGLNEYGPVSLPKTKRKFHTPASDKLIIFYSGSASTRSGPEADLKEDANIMLTYHDMHRRNIPDARFGRVMDARKRRAKKLKKRGITVKDNLACS